MIQKIRHLVLVTLASFTFLLPSFAGMAVATASAGAACSNDIQSSLGSGADKAAGTSNTCTSTNNDNGTGALGSLANQVVKWFSIIVGAISIIMIIYGGFRYITSGGSTDRVGNAKNTIIYAIIGLI